MNPIELPSPVPLEAELPYGPPPYARLHTEYLDVPAAPPPTQGFFEVLERRHTRRHLGPLDDGQLSALLWYAAKVRDQAAAGPGGVSWQHRPSPSAGGRHPIDLLVTNRVPGRDDLDLYDPLAHALHRLDCAPPGVRRLSELAAELVPGHAGVVVWFAADFPRTLSKYAHGESLVWRDAGALLATLQLTAEALGLGLCPLGPTGEPWVSTCLGGHPAVSGVGGCVVGCPT